MDVAYFRMLWGYNSWANHKILDRAKDVSEADYYAQRPGLSFGNLHGTLLHLVGSEWVWLRRFSGVAAPRVTEEERPTLASLIELLDEVEPEQRAFLDGLTDERLGRPNTYAMPNGNTVTNELGYQMAHMVNHAMQYRSEAAVRLTELDLSPGGIDLLMYLGQR